MTLLHSLNKLIMRGGRFTPGVGEVVQRSRECILYLVLLEWCLHSVCVVLDPTVNSADRNTHGLLPLVLCLVLNACVGLRYQVERRDARGISSLKADMLSNICRIYGMTLCLLFSFVSSAQLLLLLLLVEVYGLSDSGYGFMYHFFTLVYLTRDTCYSNVLYFTLAREYEYSRVEY